MATYKVIQDIEAEDHILGPLSLRQFIYGLIAAFCFYLCYIAISKHAAFLIALFLPPGLFCTFFAVPFGRDQPTEVWALAKIRFYFKPRKRIWDQSGVKELVSITVPKRVEIRRSDGLSQTEVRSRLSALASTIDSRGWAVKDVDVNLYTRPGLLPLDSDSDRLIDTGAVPQAVPSYSVSAADDIMDERNNPIAQQFDQMINASTMAHRQQLEGFMHQDSNGGTQLPAPVSTAAPSSDWFLQQATPLGVPTSQPGPGPGVVAAAPLAQSPSANDLTVSNKLKAQNAAQDVTYSHMKTIQPLGQQPAAPAPPVAKVPSFEATQLAANNDLNISTLARVANKQDLSSDDEVIIPLH